MLLSVIVPCYNEEVSLPFFLPEIGEVAGTMSATGSLSLELLFVDDGSTDAIFSMGEYNRFSKGIFGWVGFRTCWLPYKNVERVAGETKWPFWKLFRYSIKGIAAFSTPFPLPLF